MNRLWLVFLAAAVAFSDTALLADTFGSGADAFDIDFVTIGNPGNPPDANPNPAGAVPYSYRIGKYEISEQMIDKANAESALAGSALNITKDTRGPDYPATSVTWYEAAKFVNWLNTSSGSAPAYKFDGSGNFQLLTSSDAGYDPNNLYRNSLAHYFLPSVDEWHKAAYYNPGTGTYFTYPTGSNNVPDGIDFPGDPSFDAIFNDGGNDGGPNVITNVGLQSPYGTEGQGGNVSEWIETAFDWNNNSATKQRSTPGGSWGDIYPLLNGTNSGIGITPQFQANFVGFRVVTVVPEPSSLCFAALGLVCVSLCRRRMTRASILGADYAPAARLLR